MKDNPFADDEWAAESDSSEPSDEPATSRPTSEPTTSGSTGEPATSRSTSEPGSSRSADGEPISLSSLAESDDESGVERAGANPPSDERIEDVSKRLRERMDSVDNVYLARVSFVAGSTRSVGDRLLRALEAKVTVVSSSLQPDVDPVEQGLDILIETDHDEADLAAALTNLDVIDGAVVADVSSVAPTESSTDTSGLDLDLGDDDMSMYWMDDHLIFTPDVSELVADFFTEFERSSPAADSVEPDEQTSERLDTIERHLSQLETTKTEILEVLEYLGEEVDSAKGVAHDAREQSEDLRIEFSRLDNDLSETDAEVDALESELSDISADVDALEPALSAKADETELESLREHVESEVPTVTHIESLFASISRRIDDPETHNRSVVEVLRELDSEARESHALRNAGFVSRLRWLVSGRLPDE